MGKPLTDPKGRPVVVVTGMGLITALGQGTQDNWAALSAGQSGIRHITRFPTDGLRTTIAGTVDFLNVAPYSAYTLSLTMARECIKEALAEAAIGSKGDFPGPLFIATPPSEFEWPQLRALHAAGADSGEQGYRRLLAAARTGDFAALYPMVQFTAIAEALAQEFGVRGQPISLCTACASGVSAIQHGLEAIRWGKTEAALCVATDATVHLEGLVRFSLLSALSTQNDPPEKAPKPFAKDRDGFVIAEGAAALVLESYDSAKARGAKILGVVRGCGERADVYHRTRSKPDGSAIIGAIENTLADACVTPEAIDYVNAHGTSTPENDRMEYLSLRHVFGDRLPQIPVSSNKSMVGHTLIAAGAVEAVFSFLTLRHGFLPPTLNYDNPDPDLPLDVVPFQGREADVSVILSNSFGFGGQNVCGVFSREPA